MRRRHFAMLALVLPAAACSSPEPSYYTLAPVPGAAAGGAPRTITLRRVGLAGYLDRSDIVNADTGYRLRIANNQLWGEPLGDMIGRVLAEDLTQRLPGSAVFSEAGAISTDTDATIEIDVQRFDSGAGEPVTLLAQVAISHGRGNTGATPAVTRSFRLVGPGTAPGTSGQVAAMSAVLGQLADAVAAMLRGVGA